MQTLFDLSKQNHSRLFFAVDPRQGWSLELACSLTPRLMQWSKTAWLLDITPCLSYWGHDGGDIAFWESVLNRLGFNEDAHIAIANSPWQALLLLRQMQARRLTGILSITKSRHYDVWEGQDAALSSFALARHIYNESTWKDWLHLARESALHFSLGEVRGFSSQRFLKQLKLLERNIAHLGLLDVGQYRHVASHQFRKRFGTFIQLLWEWTWIDECSVEAGFPWHDVVHHVKPSVSRHLDHPLSTWSDVAPLLCQDLNRLCDHPYFNQQEKVVRLEWRLVLTNLKTLSISLTFRHPHSLHQSRPQQKTALLQAGYAFSRDIVTFKQQQPMIEDAAHQQELWIIGWSLDVIEKVTSSPELSLLFESENSKEIRRLQELENFLPIELQEYRVFPSWVPEEASAIALSSCDVKLDTTHHSLLLDTAKHRPLYLFHRPRHLCKTEKSSMWKFCERTTAGWWQQSDFNQDMEAAIFYRDYYLMSDVRKRHWWVYQDTSKRWYLHGVFA